MIIHSVLESDQLCRARLWGDNFFNPATRKWSTKATADDGKTLERAFNQFVLDPIFKIFDAVMNFKKDAIGPILEKLDVKLAQDEHDLEGKALLKVVMRKFLPAGDSLLEMIVSIYFSPHAMEETNPVVIRSSIFPVQRLLSATV